MVPPAGGMGAEHAGCDQTPEHPHEDRHRRPEAAVRAPVQPQRLHGLQGRHQSRLPAPRQLRGRHRRVHRPGGAAAEHRLHLQTQVHQRRYPHPPAETGGRKRQHRRHLPRGALLALRHHGRAAGLAGQAVQAARRAGRNADLPWPPCELPLLESGRPRRQAHRGGIQPAVHGGRAETGDRRRSER